MTMEPVVGEILESRSPEQWAALVRADLGQAVAGFVAAGRHLIEARTDTGLTGYAWEGWLKDRVGISPTHGSMLMAIAQHPFFQDHYYSNDLPPSWRTLYELSQLEEPLLRAAITAGRVTPRLEQKEARALVIEYKTMAAEVSYDLRHGDFRDLEFEPKTVDAIITDPPYPAEFLPLYGRKPIGRDADYGSPIYSDMDGHGLSEIAAEVLKPGGICAVMVGQSHLPEVMERLSQQLTYHWTMAYLTPGGQAVQIFPRRINTFWKPILVFTNGAADSEWFGDVAKSDTNDNDKRFHHWGQSESGMADLIKRLTRPGATVLDPFMGAGTTGVAAIALGRSFIGCDVNADHVESARGRIDQTILERLG